MNWRSFWEYLLAMTCVCATIGSIGFALVGAMNYAGHWWPALIAALLVVIGFALRIGYEDRDRS